MSFDLDRVLEHCDGDLDAAISRLGDLLRIPSVSTDPAFDGETQRAARHMADDLASIGFDASVRETTGHPMVVAHHPGPPGVEGPRFLYYGHYDVQPPDPLEQWESPPFEPTIVEGPHGRRIVARGAVDDKGQLMTFVEAFRAWNATHGTLPVAVTVLLEGEEESGSPSLDPFLEANRDELAAEVCIVCDTGMWDIDTPAVTTMLRGLVYVEVTLHGPTHDLHSGMYGGAVLNPINALARILGELVDDHGRVQVPGFYDDVRDLDPETAAQWAALNFDEAAFLAGAGLEGSVGEIGRTVLERVWSRPTCDVNGIHGGYTGDGAKTVIGACATAKVSCRLVADQDPDAVLAGLRSFFETRTPPGGRWEFQTHGASPAIRINADSPYLAAACNGLARIYGKEAASIGTGGSIPLVGSIQRILNYDSLLVGFGLDDDRMHSPNEKFEVRCFANGIKSHAAILAELAKFNA